MCMCVGKAGVHCAGQLLRQRGGGAQRLQEVGQRPGTYVIIPYIIL